MAELDHCNILQLGHLVRSRLSRAHDSVYIQKLSISRLCMLKCEAMCSANDKHLASLDLRETRVSEGTRYPYNLCGSRTSNVWSGEPRFYVMRIWH
jgi:hypothetical protein